MPSLFLYLPHCPLKMFMPIPNVIGEKMSDDKNDKKLFVLPLRMVSQDSNSNVLRCGVISIFVHTHEGKWIGMTNVHLFAKSWIPQTGWHDTKEDLSIIGKIAYEGAWVDPKHREDITTTDAKVITVGRELGVVMMVINTMAYVQMNDGVIDETKGNWTGIADPEKVQPGAKLHLVTPESPKRGCLQTSTTMK